MNGISIYEYLYEYEWNMVNFTTCNYLVGGLEHEFYYFPNSWDDDPIWRTHIFQGLKPPTSISDIVQGQWSTSFLYLYLYILYEWIVRIIKKSGNAWTMRSFLSWTMTTVDDHPLFWSVDGMVKCSHGTHTGWETALWDRTGDKTCSSYLLVINVTVQSNKHERKEVPNRAM
jgi:hypothetical protein